jgi:hypothetical protein
VVSPRRAPGPGTADITPVPASWVPQFEQNRAPSELGRPHRVQKIGGMPPVGLPSVSPSSDPAHGTWVGARRSMRHANSPRPLRLVLSPRRFRHTAVSPPPCTSHVPAAHGGRCPPGEIFSHRSGRDSFIFANFARFERFASSRKRHSLPGCSTWIRVSSGPPAPRPRPTPPSGAGRRRHRCPRPTGG